MARMAPEFRTTLNGFLSPHLNAFNFGIYSRKARVLIKQTISALKRLFIGSAWSGFLSNVFGKWIPR